MPAGTTPLGKLLSSAYTSSRALWKPILIGAVVFGTVMTLTQGAIGVQTAERMGGMMEEIGIDPERMQELQLRIEAGDDQALVELEALMQESLGTMDDTMMEEKFGQMGKAFVKAALPSIGIMALIAIVVSAISSAYYLILALGQSKNAQSAAQKALPLILPLLGVWIWSFLRSFAWIPLVGIVLAIIFGPRFALAPVILVKEGKGVMESVSLSYVRTTGYWGKIVGNAIVMGLCVAIAGVILAMISSIFGAFHPAVSMWILSVGKYVFMAYAVIFLTQLSLTVMANPMVVGKKK